MKKYGMMMVCGNSVEELEQNLQAMKMAMATGAMMGCGGSSIEDVETGIAMLGGSTSVSPCDCPCCSYVDENTEPPTIGEILDMVETGELTAGEGIELIHRHYEIEE